MSTSKEDPQGEATDQTQGKKGAPIIEQCPRYTTPSGKTFVSVPGPVPVVKAKSANKE